MERVFSSSEGSFKTSDFGAHVFDWTTSDHSWLFLSRQTSVLGPKAIRGGVPIIFPQFNEFGPGKRHGFARNTQWSFNDALSNESTAVFQLKESDESLSSWPYRFSAQFKVQIKKRSLSLSLQVDNTDGKPFEFTAALHSYFNVDNIYKTHVEGLKGLKYWDNDGSDFKNRHVFEDDFLSFAGAIDRVYFAIQQMLTLSTPKGDLLIEQSGFEDAVIWNPGIEGAKALADLADEDYQNMLCIEAAQIDKPIKLGPGEQWTGEQILSVLP